jgi:Xaa-Pro aminopeptidase
MTINHQPSTISPARLERAQNAMAAAGIDALLLTPGPDLRYLTGLGDVHAGERLVALLLTRDGQGLWISPAMNAPQVAACAAGFNDIRIWTDATGYGPLVAGAARELGLGGKTVAVDEEMRARFLLDLQDACPGARCVGAGTVMRGQRIRKDAEEIRRLTNAGALADAVIAQAQDACRPGRAEREVADELEAALAARAPGYRPAFCIVASGPNGALPHHDTGARRLAPGELVVLDYGGYLDDYVCDITLTLSLGEPADAEAMRVYRIVWEAQQRALEVVRPGVTCGEVDCAARSQIEAAGYGAHFLHRTGHGVGLQIHEPPYLAAGSQERLEEGMCFSVEPGIYLPDRFGARLEVLAAVTRDGVQLLNAPSSRELVRAA